MGFLDDFGKKLSSAGQEAIAKTKDLADIAKLNSGISEEENKIKAAFLEIGKLYFEFHPDDYEGCFESYFVNVKESKGKIEDYEKQIAEIKGVRKCPNCGMEVPKTAAFCAACGNAMPVVSAPAEESVPEQEERRCPSCGELLGEGSAFCPKCGTKIENM